MNTTTISARKHSRSYFLTGLIATCLAVAATGVRAQDKTAPGAEPTKMVVHYADLNLVNPRAVDELYRRIASAAHQVCDSRDRSLQAQARDGICKKQSIARAVAVVNQPALTAFYAQKNGQPPYTFQIAKQ
ncbi:MAG: UrcA family protein [Steroidobacteraceae bacterium]|jgi:UrcA family protein